MATYTTARQIFEVHATIVDSTGARNVLTDFPKVYDSKNQQFNNDVAACQQRAEAEAYKTFGDMLLVTTRQVQTVILQTVDGRQVLKLEKGTLAPVEVEVPEPEPEQNQGEENPETPTEGEGQGE